MKLHTSLVSTWSLYQVSTTSLTGKWVYKIVPSTGRGVEFLVFPPGISISAYTHTDTVSVLVPFTMTTPTQRVVTF